MNTKFLALGLLLALGGAPAQAAVVIDSGTLSGLGARNIGSAAMSGRISALAARNAPDGRVTLYVGAASGGVWKSLDGATTFKPVFDKQAVQSIGSIAIDPSAPETVWVGTGEAWTRNSVSVGDGIYKSSDGGETWSNMGLPESERIARIIVHPKNGAIVYACVPGKLWSDSAERGLYKTADGGKTWKQVLKGANLSTGCGMVAMDPKDPETLFASLWDFRRKGWTFRSGGDGPDAFSGSGLHVSHDGGRSWTELTPAANKGFPAKPYGRIAVTVAPSNPKVVYAMVESTRSALFRSADGGRTWTEGDRSQWMVWRPFYFANLIVDPRDENRVFKPDGVLIISSDGGKSFSAAGNFFAGIHGDAHDVWLDPQNPKHAFIADDGGLWISYDGATTFWKGENLPVSQFYHVSVDDQDPYKVYGGLQDNSVWVGDSQFPGGITNSRWESIYGGDGFWALPDPTDPDYVYTESQGGFIGRVNRRTHEVRDLQPKAGLHEKLRYNWNTPIALSPSDPKTLYLGAQFLFRSRDQGQTWQRISPDLTTNDPAKQKQEESGGVTVDNSAAEMHETIYSISESPKDAGVVWAGTDDGNLQLTRDGGGHWTNVAANVPGLPANSWVSWVEASRYQAGTAYAAFDRHSFGDLTPHVFRTTDFGATWTRIADAAQGVRGYAHVVREDPVRPGLLYLGTEFGLWISLDGGAQWAQFKGSNFPAVAVRDLAFPARDGDLVIATHGRGIWIIDDLAPLRALTPQVLEAEAAFVAQRPVQQRFNAQGGWANGNAVFVGANPPDGAVINFYQQKRHLFGKLKLEVLDAQGAVVETLPAPQRRGLNRVVWPMRVKAPQVPQAAQLAGNAIVGPRVLPGDYTLRLTKGGKVYEAKLPVVLDRRARYSAADRKLQFDAVMRVHRLFGEMSALVDRINAVRSGAAQRIGTLPKDDPLRPRLQALSDQADELRRKIVATKEGGAITGEERLREHADILYGALLSYEGRPGDYQLERIDVLEREFREVTAAFDALKDRDLVAGLPAPAPASGSGGLASASLWGLLPR